MKTQEAIRVRMLDLKREYEYMKDEIDSALARCMRHQTWILGPEVRELEEKMSVYLGSDNCVGLSSGTEALVVGLRALAISHMDSQYFGKADEIITTPFTFTATGDAILRAGATPVLIDIDPRTYNIDAEKIRQYLKTASNRVVGIAPVHLYGCPCDMDAIMDIAREAGLFVLEDVAQALGGQWKGRKLGTIGTAGAFSFFPSKNLGGFGDGGMLCTDDHRIADVSRMLIKHGGRDKYNVEHIGYNARLDTIQAAILLSKLPMLDEFNANRIKAAASYTEKLSGMDGLVLPAVPDNPENATHVFHQYTIRVPEGRRDELQKHLADRGITTMVYYPVPLHKMKVFHGRYKTLGLLDESEKAAKEVLSLPMDPLMTPEEIDYVAESVREFFRA